MSRFLLSATPIQGVLSIQRQTIEDARGFFSRFYCAEEFKAAGVQKSIEQINHTMTRVSGTVRGLHFQRPGHAEIKLVSCVRGSVWDVAVDLRRGSPTFLKWHAQELSEKNLTSLLIPEGCAHGFQALEPDSELIYLHTAAYHAPAEGALNPSDPQLAIAWPLPITEMSERDRNHAMIDSKFEGIEL